MANDTQVSISIIKFASIFIIIAGLMAAQSIVIPILLAIFITILTSPIYKYLQKIGLPSSLALMAIMLMLVVGMSLLAAIITASVNNFSANLPFYEQRLHIHLAGILDFLHNKGMDVTFDSIINTISPNKITSVASTVIQGIGSALTNSFMIFLLVAFMLLEVPVLPAKIAALPRSYIDTKMFLDNVKQYMKIKSIFSLITGSVVYILLSFIGLDYALLWGVLAFVLNYIPNIGSIIAAMPAVLLASIQFGFLGALKVAIVFIVVNVLIGSILEPKYMGKGLGLSTLVVFISLLFWGWIFGPLGMLLSIPLTIMLKLAMQSNPNTVWVSILLGSDGSEANYSVKKEEGSKD